MKTIDPIPGRIKELMKTAPMGQPIVMINLLKFREHANYPADSDDQACSGVDAYQRYIKRSMDQLTASGGEIIWQGEGLGSLIAPPDEDWDKALIIKWSSFETFLSVIMSEEYQKGTVHRTAALQDSRLLMMQ